MSNDASYYHRWEPWDDYKAEEEILPIDEPPCRFCKYFRPARIFNARGEFDGVAICRKLDMEHDFSCYESAPNEGGDI